MSTEPSGPPTVADDVLAEPYQAVADEPLDEPAGLDERPEPPLTGDDAVDRAVAEVADALDRPLEEQVAVIDAVHRTLQDRLADVEG